MISKSKNPWRNSTREEWAEWWEPAPKPVPLPEFIEKRAKDQMKLVNGKIQVKRKGTNLDKLNAQSKGLDVLVADMIEIGRQLKGHK